MLIKSENNLTIGAPRSYLSNPESAGTTVFRFKNTNSIGSQWAIQIGETGEETAEVLLISGTPSGTVGTTTAASRFDHPADTVVYPIKWNQVVFERSTSGTSGTATPMTDGTVTITPDNLDTVTGKSYTIFDDPTGVNTYAYKTYFRNSAIPLTSVESDWIVTVPNFYSLGAMRARVRDKLWDSNFLTDGQIDSFINEWKDEMHNAAISVNEDYLIGTVNVAFSANTGLGTISDPTFRTPQRVEVTYNGIDYFLSTKRPMNTFLPSEVVNAAHPYHDWQGENVLHVLPHDQAGTAKVYFGQIGTPMVNDGDQLPYPMRSYTRSFVDYALGRAYQKDNKPSDATGMMNAADVQKLQFVREISPRDRSSTTMVNLNEVVSGEDDLFF